MIPELSLLTYDVNTLVVILFTKPHVFIKLLW